MSGPDFRSMYVQIDIHPRETWFVRLIVSTVDYLTIQLAVLIVYRQTPYHTCTRAWSPEELCLDLPLRSTNNQQSVAVLAICTPWWSFLTPET